MHQKCLHCITSSRVVSLGINNNFYCLVQVTKLIQVCVTNTISMTKNWDGLGSLLDGSDKFIRASRDNQVDIVVQLEEV